MQALASRYGLVNVRENSLEAPTAAAVERIEDPFVQPQAAAHWAELQTVFGYAPWNIFASKGDFIPRDLLCKLQEKCNSETSKAEAETKAAAATTAAAAGEPATKGSSSSSSSRSTNKQKERDFASPISSRKRVAMQNHRRDNGEPSPQQTLRDPSTPLRAASAAASAAAAASRQGSACCTPIKPGKQPLQSRAHTPGARTPQRLTPASVGRLRKRNVEISESASEEAASQGRAECSAATPKQRRNASDEVQQEAGLQVQQESAAYTPQPTASAQLHEDDVKSRETNAEKEKENATIKEPPTDASTEREPAAASTPSTPSAAAAAAAGAVTETNAAAAAAADPSVLSAA